MFDTILKIVLVACCTFWLWIWIPGVLWRCVFKPGKHDYQYITRYDYIPNGLVWFSKHNGTWMTQPRSRDWPKPRKFSERSNPLDHEFTYTKQQVPPKFINVAKEVEY